MNDHSSHREDFFGSCCCWYRVPFQKNLCRITRQQHANFSLKPWFELETGGTFSATCYCCCCCCNLFSSDHYSVWILSIGKELLSHLPASSWHIIFQLDCSFLLFSNYRGKMAKKEKKKSNFISKLILQSFYNKETTTLLLCSVSRQISVYLPTIYLHWLDAVQTSRLDFVALDLKKLSNLQSVVLSSLDLSPSPLLITNWRQKNLSMWEV